MNAIVMLIERLREPFSDAAEKGIKKYVITTRKGCVKTGVSEKIPFFLSLLQGKSDVVF